MVNIFRNGGIKEYQSILSRNGNATALTLSKKYGIHVYCNIVQEWYPFYELQ